MHLNVLAIILIAFLPLLLGYYWYHPKSILSKYSGYSLKSLSNIKKQQIIKLYILSIMLVVGYANLVIHQMGFYELFMTDIIKGNIEYKTLVDNFLAKYGHKHRHFGHGVFHGGITAVLFALPFVVMNQILEQKTSHT